MEHSTPEDSPTNPPTSGESDPSMDARSRQLIDEHIAAVAERAAKILKRWAVTSERHEHVVDQLESQLSEFEVASARLQRDTTQKMQDLERVVHHEWTALRELHEEPIRQLREQANNLTEVCIATAHSAQKGFDLAEQRLTAIERDLHQRFGELRGEVQSVLSEVRGTAGAAHLNPAPQQAWPLDGVARLHQQLRQTPEHVELDPEAVPLLEYPTAREVARAAAAPTASPIQSLPPAAFVPQVVTSALGGAASAASPAVGPAATVQVVHDPELNERLRSLERAIEERGSAEPQPRSQSMSPFTRVALVALALGVLGAAAFAWWAQSRLQVSVADAQRRAEEVTANATEQVAATREEAGKEIAAAREVATQAQIVSAALAAPDLVRFVLAGTGADGTAGAQALWSRTRGFVLSGSRLPTLSEDKVYQIWLLTRGEAVSAGTVRPDASGSATLAVAPPTTLPVIGVVATEEPVGGSPRPIGRPLLVRERREP